MKRAILSIAAMLVLTTTSAAAFVIEGAVYDGAASYNQYIAQQPSWRVPLTDQAISLELIPGGHTWSSKTDAQGRFALETGLASTPKGARLVIHSKVGGSVLYSASLSPAGSVEAFLYRTIDYDTLDELQHKRMQAELTVALDLVGEREERNMRVRVEYVILNGTPNLFVGSREKGGKHRAVFRLPIFSGAVIEKNSGPFEGMEWKVSEDGAWLVIDEPVPGVADLIAKTEAGSERDRASAAKFWSWQVTYIVPARQSAAMTIEPMHKQTNVRMFGQTDAVSVVSPQFGPKQGTQDPFRQVAGGFDEIGGGIKEGEKAVFGINVDNAVIGEVSHRAIKWHGAYLIVALIAILLGLVFSPKQPPAEAQIEGLSRDEILDRVTALDARLAAKTISAEEHRKYRAALVEIVAEDVAAEDAQKSSGGATAESGASAATETVSAIPEEVQDLLRRVEEIDQAGSTSSEAIQERTQLLEFIYKKLTDQERTG